MTFKLIFIFSDQGVRIAIFKLSYENYQKLLEQMQKMPINESANSKD